jgi:uncharacterized membrane protein
MILTILLLLLTVEIVVIVTWLITRERWTMQWSGLQQEVDLRLTYKRYKEMYPSDITYEEYKRMQSQRAYRKAVSSTKIKRMVR